MFGFLDPQMAPGDPVEFALSMPVAAPPEQVYALIDWADPRNAQRALGHLLHQTGKDPESWRMFVPTMPDIAFDFEVTEAEPERAYAYRFVADPGVGRLAWTHETFTIKPLEDGSCELSLKVVAQFQPMRAKFYEEEISRMSLGCHNALVKIRVHAEYGAQAVAMIEMADVEQQRLAH